MENNTISDHKYKINPFYAIKIFEKGKELDPKNKKTIHLSLGEPSASLPKIILEKIGKKILKKKIGYTESIGLLELRKEIVKHYKTRYNINISLDQVAVTSGASASILLILMTSFKPGDTVAIPPNVKHKVYPSMTGESSLYRITNTMDPPGPTWMNHR